MQNTNAGLTTLTRQVVLATLMAGIAVVFILIEREPGWQPFLVSGLLAIIFLFTSLSRWRNSEWLGLLALTVLVLTTLWDRKKPTAAVIGVVLVMLNALRMHPNSQAVEESNVREWPEEEGK